MEVFNGHICVTGAEAIAVIGSTYNTLLKRKKIINVVGGVTHNKPALYPVDSFPQKYRAMLYKAYPELSNEDNRREIIEEQNAILRNILPDPKAHDFFARYEKLPGIFLTPEERTKYINSAKILNALRLVYELSYSHHSRAGKAHKFREMEFWQRQSKIMPTVSEKYLNSLPWNHRGLQRTYKEYAGNNYAALLSGKIGNKNKTKKQRKLIEQMVISIYGAKTKPFMNQVCAIYNEFVLGLREIYNHDTGEVFNRADFYHKGEPLTVSDGMVFNILNDPLNRKVVDRMRNDFQYNQNKHNAAVDRKRPYHSLSKISMDDRDLVRKCVITGKKGKKTTAWVHAYYAFDVASDCIIGAAYSLKKDANLVMDCYRDMWNNLRTCGLRTPGECEVENHLIKGTAIEEKLDRTFMFTTFAAPLNSRQKRAEHKIKAKKWHDFDSEVGRGMAKGRHSAKHEAFLFPRQKVFDEMNDTYKDSLEAWTFDDVVKEDRKHIEIWNNNRHTFADKKTKQLMYPGMTRMQVLMMKQHPELAPLNWRLLCKEWGKITETSLKQGRSFTVDYREWWLSDVSLIERFKPNNTNAQAYYIPDSNGNINELFVYQDERFIDNPRDLGRFQEAKIERTDDDVRVMNAQLGFISSHKKLAKDAKAERHLGKMVSVKTEMIEAVIANVPINEGFEDINDINENGEFEMVLDYAGYDLEDYAAKAVSSM